MIKLALVTTLCLAFSLYAVALLLSIWNALITRPNYKFPLKNTLKVFWQYFTFAGMIARWNVFKMIWQTSHDIKRAFKPEYREELRRRDEVAQEHIKQIGIMPGTLVVLYTTRLLELKEFYDFKYDMTWVIPALYSNDEDDSYRSKCPFELTKDQRDVAVQLYKEVAAQVIDVLNAKSHIKAIQLLPAAIDNPAVWASYERLGMGGWTGNPDQRFYQLPDWEKTDGR